MTGLAFNRLRGSFNCPRPWTAAGKVSSTARNWYGPHPEITYPEGFLGAGKESGDLEFDAAVVLYFDVLPEVVDGGKQGRIAVAKCRPATTGFVGAKFYGGRGACLCQTSDPICACRGRTAILRSHDAGRDQSPLYRCSL